jgi:hypothetical protein
MLSKSNRGALAELRVATTLAQTGIWSVYYSLLPNGDIDLVIIHNRYRRAYKVQVKSVTDQIGVSAASNIRNLRQGANDILAVVTPESILYKVRDKRTQRLFPGSVLARNKKTKMRQPVRQK